MSLQLDSVNGKELVEFVTASGARQKHTRSTWRVPGCVSLLVPLGVFLSPEAYFTAKDIPACCTAGGPRKLFVIFSTILCHSARRCPLTRTHRRSPTTHPRRSTWHLILLSSNTSACPIPRHAFVQGPAGLYARLSMALPSLICLEKYVAMSRPWCTCCTRIKRSTRSTGANYTVRRGVPLVEKATSGFTGGFVREAMEPALFLISTLPIASSFSA